jgi:predicted permease
MKVSVVAGRPFTAEDDRRGGGPEGPVVVLSYDFWRRQYGSADLIGRQLTLNEVPFTIIGVTPPGFSGPDVGQPSDVFVPLGAEPLIAGNNTALGVRARSWLNIMVRRKPGQTVASLEAAFRTVQQDIRDALPPDRRVAQDLEAPFALVPASTGLSPLRDRYLPALVMLLIVAAGLLAIACVNVANLMMARAITRHREMSVRIALGASQARVRRQLMIEASALACTAALLGMALAQVLSRLLVSEISTPDSMVSLNLSPDWRVWGFATASAIVTAVLFGVGPAWQSARANPIAALKEQGRSTVGSGRSFFSTSLIVLQVALTLAILVATGLFLRTSSEMARRHVGSTRDRVLVMNITAPMTRYTLEQLTFTYQRVLERVRAVPGVEHASISDLTPAGGGSRTSRLDFPGMASLSDRDRLVSVNVISPGWLRTYGVRLLAGRDLAETDRENTPPVALVNQAFVRRYMNGGQPVGRSVSLSAGPAKTSVEIVGLIEDTVYRSLREPPTPAIYTSTLQRAEARPFISVSVLAARSEPMELTNSITAAVREIDPRLALRFRSLPVQLGAAMNQERVVAALSGFFGALALLLASLGLYGVTSHGVSLRRSEIAMRMAMGAESTRVIGLVMRRTAILVGIGIAAGALLSFWAVQFVESLVFGLEPHDLATFAGAAATLVFVSALAAGLPAWRASRISPAQVLKQA